MSDIPRWAEGFRAGGVRAVDGEWVRYDDHLGALAAQATAHEAALVEARRMGRPWVCRKCDSLNPEGFMCFHCAAEEAREQGVSDERARIRAGVKALVRFDHNGYALVVYPDGDFLDRVDVLAVIDEEKP